MIGWKRRFDRLDGKFDTNSNRAKQVAALNEIKTAAEAGVTALVELRRQLARECVEQASVAAARRANAVRRLAQCLYETMERVDPPADDPPMTWAELREWDQEFYALCVVDLLSQKEDVMVALSEAADDRG